MDTADTDDDDDGDGGGSNSGAVEHRQEYGSRRARWPQRRHLEPARSHGHHNRHHVIGRGNRSADSNNDSVQHCGSNSGSPDVNHSDDSGTSTSATVANGDTIDSNSDGNGTDGDGTSSRVQHGNRGGSDGDSDSGSDGDSDGGSNGDGDGDSKWPEGQGSGDGEQRSDVTRRGRHGGQQSKCRGKSPSPA